MEVIVTLSEPPKSRGLIYERRSKDGEVNESGGGRYD